jgi:hypothetical protein
MEGFLSIVLAVVVGFAAIFGLVLVVQLLSGAASIFSRRKQIAHEVTHAAARQAGKVYERVHEKGTQVAGGLMESFLAGRRESARATQQAHEPAAIIQAIRENVEGASAEISYLEGLSDPRAVQKAARALHHHVLACDRNPDAVEALQPKIQRMLQAGPSGVGVMIATRLVISGVLCEQLSGMVRMEALTELAHLQGLLHAFMERHGSPRWAVQYRDVEAFETYRRGYLAKLSAQNAAESRAFDDEAAPGSAV